MARMKPKTHLRQKQQSKCYTNESVASFIVFLLSVLLFTGDAEMVVPVCVSIDLCEVNESNFFWFAKYYKIMLQCACEILYIIYMC